MLTTNSGMLLTVPSAPLETAGQPWMPWTRPSCGLRFYLHRHAQAKSSAHISCWQSHIWQAYIGAGLWHTVA